MISWFWNLFVVSCLVALIAGCILLACDFMYERWKRR